MKKQVSLMILEALLMFLDPLSEEEEEIFSNSFLDEISIKKLVKDKLLRGFRHYDIKSQEIIKNSLEYAISVKADAHDVLDRVGISSDFLPSNINFFELVWEELFGESLTVLNQDGYLVVDGYELVGRLRAKKRSKKNSKQLGLKYENE